jgi:hypothetical protein
MNRALLVISNAEARTRALRMVDGVPFGTRLEFKETKRTLDQNAKMWAMLTEISLQKVHFGRRYPPDIWKCLMMHACGSEVQFIPSLDGSELIPWAYRSSDLSIAEMGDLIEFMFAWGAQNDVVFHDSDGAP